MLDRPEHSPKAVVVRPPNEDRFVIKAAQRAFKRASKEAVAENDRLGIATHGGKNGEVIERCPKPVLRSAGG
jgi:hypothetical protein